MKQRAGFTLVELLVVVGIMVLLAAIIFPKVRSTMETAHRTMAGSNLAEIGRQAIWYVQEQKGYLPNDIWGHRENWLNALYRQVYGTSFMTALSDNDGDYMKTVRGTIFYSRAAERVPPPQRCFGWSGRYRPGIAALEGVPDEERFKYSVRLAAIPHPEAMMLAATTGGGSNVLNAEGLGYRYNDLAVILFADGRVEYRRREEVPQSVSDVFWTGRAK